MSKHFRYLSYVLRHKWFVLLAGLRIHVPVHRLVIHDWSKFLPSEWMPYAAFFYAPKPERHWRPDLSPNDIEMWPAREQERRRAAFDRAWLHHQHFNAHHWQHWVLREDSGATKCLQMPAALMGEMVADWMGAGRAITGKWDARTWYEKNAQKIQLHEQTREQVVYLLSRLFPTAPQQEDTP